MAQSSSELRYTSSCFVHGVKGQVKEGIPGAPRIRSHQVWSKRKEKGTQNPKRASQHTRGMHRTEIIFLQFLRHPWSLAQCQGSPQTSVVQLEAQNCPLKTTREHVKGGRLWITQCRAGTATLTLYYLGDFSFARLVVTKREKYFRWKAVTL